MPSVLGVPATRIATVILVAEGGDPSSVDAVAAAARTLPDGAGIVVVGDGIADPLADELRAALAAAPLRRDPAEPEAAELVRTSAPLGRAAALNVGIRRASGGVIVLLDTSIQPSGDVVAPLVRALDDPSVAVAGAFGLESADLRRFEEVVPRGGGAVEVAAVQGYLMAFRRDDAIARGPLDEAFRFYRNLDIWWSLTMRDEGEARPPRRAVAVPNLPLTRAEPWAWTATPVAERQRLSKRNFYRVLDRFRTRDDLAVRVR